MSDKGTRAEVHAFVCGLARLAAELQLSRYGNPGYVREKAPKDLVTETDLLCEEVLISRIEERYPDDAILSEERGGEISHRGRTWLLDPVDGTSNFARANPIFCACVSVLEEGTVVHAAVAAPRLGDLYHASLGGGAFREGLAAEEPLRTSRVGRLGDAFLLADSSFYDSTKHRKGSTPAVERLFPPAWQLRALGSAGVGGAWVAAGYVDASVGTSNKAWDYAPTALLVPEAGGRVTNLQGNPWTSDSDGLVATNGPLHEEVLALLNKAGPARPPGVPAKLDG